jgi:hypothetical protein
MGDNYRIFPLKESSLKLALMPLVGGARGGGNGPERITPAFAGVTFYTHQNQLDGAPGVYVYMNYTYFPKEACHESNNT